MNYKDIRHNYYNLIENSSDYQWSHNWSEFVGLPYIPVVTEVENWLIKNHDVHSVQRFMFTKWHYSVYMAIIYIILIPILKLWIKIRGKPYDLRPQLICWNVVLATISTLGVIRCLPEFYDILVKKGFTASFCQSDYYEDQRMWIWYIIFIWSKVPELIDTVFIMLRGGNLLTLHWVHHALTLCFCWYVFADVPGTARWMVNMNFMVHSLMYTYYALKAMRIPVPIVISISITLLQIVQMIFGTYINAAVYAFKTTGTPCDASVSVAVSGLLLYILFFLLFLNFFFRSYLFKSKQGNRNKNKESTKILNSNATGSNKLKFN